MGIDINEKNEQKKLQHELQQELNSCKESIKMCNNNILQKQLNKFETDFRGKEDIYVLKPLLSEIKNLKNKIINCNNVYVNIPTVGDDCYYEQQQIDNLEDENRSLLSKLSNKQVNITTMQIQLTNMVAKNKTCEEKKNALQAELERVKQNSERVKQELADSKTKNVALENAAIGLNQQIADLGQQVGQLQQTNGQLKKENTELLNKVNRMVAELVKMEQKLERFEAKTPVEEEKKAIIQKKLAEVKQDVADESKHNTNNDHLTSQIDKLEHDVALLTVTNASLIAKLDAMKTASDEMEQKLDSQNASLGELKEFKRWFGELNDKIKEMDDSYILPVDFDQIWYYIQKQNKKIKEILAQNEQLQNEINEQKQELDKVVDQARIVPESAEKTNAIDTANNIRASLDKTDQERKDAPSAVVDCSNQVAKLKQQIEQLKRQIVQLKERNIEITNDRDAVVKEKDALLQDLIESAQQITENEKKMETFQATTKEQEEKRVNLQKRITELKKQIIETSNGLRDDIYTVSDEGKQNKIASDQEIAKLKEETIKLTKQVGQLTNENKELTNENMNLKAQLNEMKQKSGELTGKITELNDKISMYTNGQDTLLDEQSALHESRLSELKQSHESELKSNIRELNLKKAEVDGLINDKNKNYNSYSNVYKENDNLKNRYDLLVEQCALQEAALEECRRNLTQLTNSTSHMTLDDQEEKEKNLNLLRLGYKQLNEENDELTKQVNQLKPQVDQLTDKNAELQTNINTLTKERNDLIEKIAKLNLLIEELRNGDSSELRALQAQVKELEQNLKECNEKLKECNKKKEVEEEKKVVVEEEKKEVVEEKHETYQLQKNPYIKPDFKILRCMLTTYMDYIINTELPVNNFNKQKYKPIQVNQTKKQYSLFIQMDGEIDRELEKITANQSFSPNDIKQYEANTQVWMRKMMAIMIQLKEIYEPIMSGVEFDTTLVKCKEKLLKEIPNISDIDIDKYTDIFKKEINQSMTGGYDSPLMSYGGDVSVGSIGILGGAIALSSNAAAVLTVVCMLLILYLIYLLYCPRSKNGYVKQDLYNQNTSMYNYPTVTQRCGGQYI
jgi:chromosome segregation ATPase